LQFGPKIEKEKDQKKKLDESNEKLAALDRQLDELNSVQKTLEDGIKEMELSKSDLEKELEELESDATNSNSMLQKLKDEKGEYGARKDLLEKERQFIDGDCILAASMMVYGGVCYESQRPDLMKIFFQKLNYLGIKINDKYSLSKFNANENTIADWNDHGLPEDEFSNENAILTLMSYRTC